MSRVMSFRLLGTTSDMAIIAAAFAAERELMLHALHMQTVEDVTMPLVLRLEAERRKAALH